MASIFTSKITRDKLARIFGNHEAVKLIENLTTDVTQSIPASVSAAEATANTAAAQASAAQTTANAANATANAALALAAAGGSSRTYILQEEADFEMPMLMAPGGGSGSAGPTGPTGPAGPAGQIVCLEAPEADEVLGMPGPMGPQGVQGVAGASGSQGPAGPAIYLEAPEADEPMFHLGATGPQGAAGGTGAQGPAGPAVFLEADPIEPDFITVPGPAGPSGAAGLLASAGGLTASTTINATTTPTTGGATLASQSAAAGAVWRIRAHGTFVAVSSATARNAVVTPFWGATALPAITLGAVLASTAQTTNWEVEFIITASSTTAVWTTGNSVNRVASATALAMAAPTPASTVVTAGAQTLDLRFSMSVVVATDQFVVHNVTFERLK